MVAQPYPTQVSRATLTLLTGLHAGRLLAVAEAGVVIGRAPDADLVVDDPCVSRHHARFIAADGGFSAEDLGSTNGTFVGSTRIGITPLHGGEIIQLGRQLLVRFAMVDAAEELLYRRLYDSSVQDPLTQLFNRKYLADRLSAEVSHARRSGDSLTLLMADVDSLKEVNDRFGHLAGDQALRIVSARVKRAIRMEDVLARYGGDEFAILAPGADAEEADRLGERVRQSVDRLRMSVGDKSVAVTLSVGVASLVEVSSADQPVLALVALADSRLYGAKSAGRNRVVTACRSA